MKVLIIGGTKYFGRHLANDLIKNGHDLFIFSRGNQDFDFKPQVTHIVGDRNNNDELKTTLKHGPFDVIFDQVCMSGKNAQSACEIFKGACKRYIMTSTGSVYDFQNDKEITEEDFDAKKYPLNIEETNPYNYQEAKRQAETYFLTHAPFQVVCVRFPIVLGNDDYTKRLLFHVEKVKKEEELYFPNIDVKMGFIGSSEAGEFLSFVGMKSSFIGSVNAVSTGFISLREMMALIEQATKLKMIKADTASETNHSPFGADKDFMMSNSKALSLGFTFKHLNVYLKELIEFFAS